ncbi:MAG: EF-hand domain-containing protein, partial [Pseudomonadota bacterium]
MKRVDNFFGASDPFFQLSDASGKVVARSKVVMNTLKPKWPLIRADLNALVDGKLGEPFTITFFDWEKDGQHQYMGQLTVTASELIEKAQGNLGIRGRSRMSFRKKDAEPSFQLVVNGENYGSVFVVRAEIGTGTPDELKVIAEPEPLDEEDTKSPSSASRSILVPENNSVATLANDLEQQIATNEVNELLASKRPFKIAPSSLIQELMPSQSEAMQVFDAIDSKENGFLTSSEVGNVWKTLLPEFKHKASVTKAFEAADIHKSGYISRKGFERYLRYALTYN